MEGATARFRINGERDLALAHTMAIFTRAKELKPLASYLPRTPARAGSMLAQLEQIAAETRDLG